MQHTTPQTSDCEQLTDVRLAVEVAVKDEGVGLGKRSAVAVGQMGCDQDILARFDLQPVGGCGCRATVVPGAPPNPFEHITRRVHMRSACHHAS